MKKFIIALVFCLCTPFFVACETSDTEIANALEGNLTRLVYSVGYLDSISVDELNNLVNGGSSYFAHSSLYSGPGVSDNLTNDPNLSSLDGSSPLAGGLNNVATISATRNSSYRSRLYDENANNTSLISNTGETAPYSAGVVDISLLETSASDLNDILLEVSTKRGIIMLYCTDLRSGRASLSAEDKIAINEYIDIIKETTNYLNNNAGALTGHYNNIVSVASNENSAEIVNARLIRANETLKTRYAKLDTCLDSLSAITNILTTRIGTTYIDLYNASLASYGNNQANTSTDINNISIDNETEIIPLDNMDNQISDNNLANNVVNETTNNNSLNNLTNGSCCDNFYNNNNCCNNSPLLLENNCCDRCNNNLNNDINITSSTCPNCPCTNLNNYSNNNLVNNNLNTGATSELSNIKVNNSATSSPISTNENLLPNIQALFPMTNNDLNLTEEEIILNGGLIKNNNSALSLNNITETNTSLPASAMYKQLKSPSAEVIQESEIKKLNITPPQNKLEEKSAPITMAPVAPISPDLSEPEIVESEKELTPDLLPFVGESDNNVTIETAPELGHIFHVPIRFEEDNPIMLIPRQ